VPDAGPAQPFPESQALALAELEELLGFHVSLADIAIKAHFQSLHCGTGLTQKQIAVLWLIGSCPGIIQSDIARLLRVQRATVAVVVRMLDSEGLVRRQDLGATDARHVPLRLSRKGATRLVAAKQEIRSHEAWVQSHFTAAERRTIARLMSRLYRPGESAA
jgi:DNA-binding MarR family transcriptional regulator